MFKGLVAILSATVAWMVVASPTKAALLQFAANSNQAGGELGYFVADDAVLALNSGSMKASDFYSYFFFDPDTGIRLDTSNVDGDTGVTFFSLLNGTWTVTGGGGDSLTDVDLGHGLWLAGDSFLSFNSGGPPQYTDVEWDTRDFSAAKAVPEPFSLLSLLGTGLAGIVFAKKAKAT